MLQHLNLSRIGVTTCLSFCLTSNTIQAQNVGIGTDTPHSSAKLHIEDTQRGILIPKVSLVNITDGITPVNGPAVGLLVWNTNSGVINGAGTGFYYWTGVIWEKIVTSNTTATSTAWELLGNAGTINGTNFLGTTDNQSLDIRTNNTIFTRITTKGQIEVLNTGSSVFVGEEAGAGDDLSNNRNVFLGYRSGYGNGTTSGSRNVGVGYTTLQSITTGTQNVAIGYESMISNTTGNFNVALGPSTLELNQSGAQNVAIGLQALQENISGNLNVAIGVIALEKNTSGGTNIAIGHSAMNENLTGYNNIAMGTSALRNNIGGYENIAIGASAVDNNTTGYANTGIGAAALGDNTTGHHNVALGHASVSNNTEGDYNVGIGFRALYYNTTGNSNTAVGREAMFENVDGISNTALGYNALHDNTTGIQNTAVGRDAYSNGVFSNSTAIGFNTQITGDNQVHLGNTSVTTISGQVNFSAYSDARIKKNIQEDVVGLDFINQLRPVTYNFDVKKQNSILGIELSDEDTYENQYAIEQIQFSGFLAQEVEDAARETGYNFSGVLAPTHEGELYKVSYAEFTVPLVKAVQELSEENERLKNELHSLELEVQEIRKLLEEKE